MPLGRAVIAAAALAAILPATASAASPFADCPTTKTFKCAVINVPLDPSGGTPGTVKIAATLLPAPTPAPSPVAVVALAGGPGQAALPLTEDFAVALAPALKTRDLLVFDQRGTGLSSPLGCRALDHPSKTLSATVRRCAQEIGQNRRFFTTAQSVADIEALRVAGGYSKLTLYGVSYGTKVALAYAAAHPDRVESLVLDSTVTPEGPDALSRSSLAAVPRILRDDLCGNGDCRRITSNPVRDVQHLAARLSKHSVKGPVYSPLGRRYTARLSASGLVSILLAGDFNPTLRAELPGAVRGALTGDVKPILRLSARSAGLANSAHFQSFEADDDALYFDTTCEDTTSVPWTRGAPQSQRQRELDAAIARLPAGSTGIFPRKVARAGIPELCLGWPTASPAPPAPGPLPDVPALLLEGQSDMRTPIEDAAGLASKLPHARLLAVPHTGHSVLGSEPSSCAAKAVAAFFAVQPIADCPSIDNPFFPTPRPPTSLSQVSGSKGYPRKIGRTVNALLATLTDGRRQIIGEALALGFDPAGAGGLRGGSVRVARSSLNFHSYEYVPGVKVSGQYRPDGTSRLTVSGKSAAHGSVTVTKGGRISGRLDGHRLSGSLIRAAAAAYRPTPLPTLAEAVRRGRLVRAGA
jgi:pimeloyl-ACP methyl ester carboxylesterase